MRFFALWEVSYKTGLVNNDLLIPSPEGLFHVFVEKPAEIGSDILGSLSLLFWGFLLAIVLGTMLGLLTGWNPEDQGGAASFVQCDYTDPAAYVFCLSDHDLFHLPSGSHRRNLLCCILADLPGNGGKSGTDRQVHY